MNNNLVTQDKLRSSLMQCFFVPCYAKERLLIYILLLTFISIFPLVRPVFAGLQQVFVDGQAGRFKQAQSELQRLSNELEAQLTSADITIVGYNCAAIGFYSILSQISYDCITGALGSEYGQKLFMAAQDAAMGELDKAASLAKEVVDKNQNYSQSKLLLARILTGNCIPHNQNCKEAIETYQRVLEMDKTLAMAYIDLGMLYQHLGKNQDAITVWEKATTQAQGQATTKWAHLMLALLYSTEEQWTQAEKHAEILRELMMIGFTDELLLEIQSHTKSNSTPGESIERKNEALLGAAKNGNIEEIRALLDRGANVNAKLKGGGTPLHAAALKGQNNIVELLIKKGADVNARDDQYGASPLHLAAYNGHKKTVQILLLAGADVNLKDSEGDTPLDNAMVGGHRDVAETIRTFIK